MANRVYYSSQGVAIGTGSGSLITVQGAQSVGISANFTLEQAFQMGRIGIYDNIITDGEVTVTASKVLDGKDTIFKLCTGSGSNNLVALADKKMFIRVASNTDEAAQSLDPAAQVGTQITGAYLSSVAYTIPVDGFATEEVSFISDNKAVGTGYTVPAPSGTTSRVAYRQMLNLTGCSLPSEVSGKNITNIAINADFGREAMFKLGQFRPYHRFANFPFEVTCEFTIANTETDQTQIDLDNVTCTSDGNLPSKTTIVIDICNGNTGTDYHGYKFTISGARLNSLNQDGGDTGGGNATTTLGYQTFNELTISG